MKILLGILLLLSAFLMPDFASADVTFLSNQTSASDTAEWTFSTVSLGTAAADRYIIAFCSVLNTTVVYQKITVGGVQLATTTVTGMGAFNFVGLANVPSGPTGDLVVTTTGGSPTSVGCGLYRVTALVSTTADDTAHDATNQVSTLTIDVSADAGNTGFIIGHAMQISSDETDNGIWAELDKQYESNTEAPNGLYQTGAFKTFAVAANVAVVFTAETSGGAQRGFAVAWQYISAVADEGVDELDVINAE